MKLKRIFSLRTPLLVIFISSTFLSLSQRLPPSINEWTWKRVWWGINVLELWPDNKIGAPAATYNAKKFDIEWTLRNAVPHILINQQESRGAFITLFVGRLFLFIFPLLLRDLPEESLLIIYSSMIVDYPVQTRCWRWQFAYYHQHQLIWSTVRITERKTLISLPQRW